MTYIQPTLNITGIQGLTSIGKDFNQKEITDTLKLELEKIETKQSEFELDSFRNVGLNDVSIKFTKDMTNSSLEFGGM